MTSDAFRKLALALPNAEERAHMRHPDFRVNGKIFATSSIREPGGRWWHSLPRIRGCSTGLTRRSRDAFLMPRLDPAVLASQGVELEEEKGKLIYS